MAIVHPFQPIQITEGETTRAQIVMRTIEFGKDSLPISILSDGEELLAAPVRIVGTEDGNPMVWETVDSFIFNRSEEQLTLCGTMQSEQFIVNTCIALHFDGCMNIDLKLMPRGMTVAQVFGLSDVKKLNYQVGNLIVEIPLKKTAKLYHFFPNCAIRGEGEDIVVPQSLTSCSGELPHGKCYLPHRALFWTGDEKRGLCIFSESDENWQPSDGYHAIEIEETETTRTIRLHLLDSHPKKWDTVYKGRTPNYSYLPLSFSFGLEPTPIKPFPEKPFLHNALHIDCFRKIDCDYEEYLYRDFGGKNGYDRMVEKGVTTLILHEKWNKIQNYPYISEPTARQVKVIIEECHKRGIKVLPYFGFEISSMSPEWSKRSEEAIMLNYAHIQESGWWRVPPQRAYVVCYNSSWQESFVKGLENLLDEYGFDGIYLDSTLNVNGCTNTKHGCGYVDGEGNLRPTYPLMANRDMLRRLYEIVEPRGGILNYHSYACCNIPAMGFTHLGWNGETIQQKLLNEGVSDLPLDYFRAEYTGRNFGIPQELIAYENRPKWTFEHATAFSIIHGILPRPNSIEEPLDFISNIWKIYADFDFVGAKWIPYWENEEIITRDEAIKCSYYQSRSGEKLIFVANTRSEKKTLNLSIDAKMLFSTTEGNQMPPYSFAIFLA